MSNVHGLFSGKRDDDDSDDDENNRFVGGIGERGGGSGLAVRPNPDDEHDPESIFRLAQGASADDHGQVRRTITMYRDGFVVDDGPYRRLDDPANADFLRSLARGQTPRELMTDSESGGGSGDVVVGLVDKRKEDYVQVFQSFSGTGTSLGVVQVVSADATLDPAVLGPPRPVDSSQPVTSIQVRLLNGQRRVIQINLNATVEDLASHLTDAADGQAFRLVSGFPPKPIDDTKATIEASGLKGAQVTMQKA